MQSLDFRLDAKQRVIQLVGTGFILLVALLQFASGIPASGVFFLLLCALSVGQFFWMTRFGVLATPEGLTLQGYTRRQFPWSQVARIYAGNFMIGQRRTFVQLTNGRVIRTWAPLHYWSMPDSAFDQKVAALQQFHVQYGNPAMQQQPQFGAPQFGAPQQGQFGPPQQGQFGAPQQPPFGAPQQQPPYGPPGQQNMPPRQW